MVKIIVCEQRYKTGASRGLKNNALIEAFENALGEHGILDRLGDCWTEADAPHILEWEWENGEEPDVESLFTKEVEALQEVWAEHFSFPIETITWFVIDGELEVSTEWWPIRFNLNAGEVEKPPLVIDEDGLIFKGKSWRSRHLPNVCGYGEKGYCCPRNTICIWLEDVQMRLTYPNERAMKDAMLQMERDRTLSFNL